MKARKCMMTGLLAISLAIAPAGFAYAQKNSAEFTPEGWDLSRAKIVDHLGRKALIGTAFLKNASLRSGIIEVDIATTERTRSYPGALFRVKDAANYERFYIRPHRSPFYDDVLQYGPVFNGVDSWQLYNGPGLTAAMDVAVSRPFTKCALEADESTRDVVRGMDAIVHLALARADRNPSEQIDGLVRATYNLLTAAAAEGVRRVVHVGSLSILRGYDEAFAVAEDWQPRPGDDAPALAEYLAECTSREFARQRQLEVVALRIGKVVRAESATDQAFDPLWVDQRDVVQAVSLALRTAKLAAPRGTDGWTVLHILSDSPRARYSVNKARQVLGYQPQHRW